MSPRLPLIAATLAIVLTACGGSGSPATTMPPAPTPPSIALSSTANQTLSGGKPVALSATVSSTDAVTWQLAAGAPGTLSASTGTTVNYLPSASVTAITQVNITASAGGSSKSFSLTLYPDPGAPGLTLISGNLANDGLTDADLLASNGQSPPDIDGPSAVARFNRPELVAADRSGNLYVSDYPGKYRIYFIPIRQNGLYLRKIAPDGMVSTIVTRQDFGIPTSMVTDHAGNLYISETFPTDGRLQPAGGAIYKMTPDGKLALLAGQAISAGGSYTQVDGTGGDARFTRPALAGVDADGNVFVRDAAVPGQTDTVRKITPAGVVSTIAALPSGIGAAPDGNSYVAEKAAVYRVTATGKDLVAGTPGKTGTQLGALPGGLGLRLALTPLGPYSFAVVSDNAILKLVLPH